jgi:hypothetical protein
MYLREIFQIVQIVSTGFLLIAGLIMIVSTGFIGTIASLTSPTATTGFTLCGLGIAIGSFVLSEISQKELLDAIKAQERKS